jgi:hypothetical protein
VSEEDVKIVRRIYDGAPEVESFVREGGDPTDTRGCPCGIRRPC